jgi:hypothetical protein
MVDPRNDGKGQAERLQMTNPVPLRLEPRPIALTSTFQSDHDTDPRFSAFISRVLHIDAHNDFRIFCVGLRPFALDNFCLFELSKEALHKRRLFA